MGYCLGSNAGLESIQAEEGLKAKHLMFALTKEKKIIKRYKGSACFKRILTIHFETHQKEGMKKEGIKQAPRTSAICLL